MLSVLYYLACVGLFLTVSLIGPILIALLANETALAARFGFYLLLGSFLFAGPILAISDRTKPISPMGRLILLFAVWVILPVIASVPIYDMTELSFVDSLFETVSGVTTSGASTINIVENWPQSILFWRVQLQWLGGFLTLVSLMLIIAPMGIGGLRDRKSTLTIGADLNAKQDKLFVFGLNLALLYATTTVICFLGFFLMGTRAFYSVTLAMTAISTGGFLPFDDSLDQIISSSGQLWLAVFLMVGATSIFWHRMILKGQVSELSKHRESYWLIGITLLLGLIFTGLYINAIGSEAQSPLISLIQGILNAASLVSTSGIQSQPGYFTLLPLVIVLFVILIGGTAYSTSGGIKYFRIGAMLVQSRSELDRLVYPNLVKASQFDSGHTNIDMLKSIWSYFVVAVLAIGIGAVVVATSGVPFEASLTATIAAFSTAGPVYSPGWGGAAESAWPAYSSFPDTGKIILLMIMLLGRLEIIALIGLINPQY